MKKSTLHGLAIASRPATLYTGVAPVLLGTAIGMHTRLKAVGYDEIIVFFATILGVLLLQIGANLVNDVKDAERGVDTSARVGPVRVTQSGLLTATTVRWAYRSCFFLGFLLALYFTYRGGPIVIWFGLLAILGAYLYTGGPYPLSHLGLGEVVAFIFFGPLAVGGTAFIQTLTWQIEPFIWGCGPGLLAAAMMAINNYRDRKTDSSTGKKTLAVIAGESCGKALPIAALFLSIVPFVFYVVFRAINQTLGLISIMAIVYIIVFRIMPLIDSNPKSLNLALKRTSQLNLIYVLFFILVILH